MSPSPTPNSIAKILLCNQSNNVQRSSSLASVLQLISCQPLTARSCVDLIQTATVPPSAVIVSTALEKSALNPMSSVSELKLHFI